MTDIGEFPKRHGQESTALKEDDFQNILEYPLNVASLVLVMIRTRGSI
jgi:hypothetical protein